MKSRAEIFSGSTIAVAKRLLGKELVHESAEGATSGLIVECEAYLSDDPASHSFRGRTARNAPMFEAPGVAYIYFIYGMHYCFNVVSGRAGTGEAVLIRALEPTSNLELMRRRRGLLEVRGLCNGPAKLVQAMGIRPDQNGLSLLQGPLRIEEGRRVSNKEIESSSRIGISKGQELLYRYSIRGSPYVSRVTKARQDL